MSGAELLPDIRRKAWASLVARAALRGFHLWRTDAADGPQRFILCYHGVLRVVDMDHLDQFLDMDQSE